jgi:hypothetical protein
VSRSQKTWDEGKDAQTLGKLKSQGCHFQIALDLFWMQRRVEARGWSRYLATIALAMYGSWWHDKDKPISNKDAWRLYGIGREKASEIYKMLCKEFDLELVPIKKGNGRDAGFIMRGVSRTGHIDNASVAQETGSVTQEAQVCHAQGTPVSRTEHLLEPIQEPNQDSFSREQTEMPTSLVPLIRRFNEGKSMNARKENERQVLMIYENYGLKTAEDQLRQAIAKEWKSISMAKYEQYNPDAAHVDSPAELTQKRRENMLVHARTVGRSCTVWDDHREEYEAVCAEVEAGEK